MKNTIDKALQEFEEKFVVPWEKQLEIINVHPDIVKAFLKEKLEQSYREGLKDGKNEKV